MKMFNIVLNSLALAAINFFSIGIGFMVYWVLRGDQLIIQIPVALILSLTGFYVWSYLIASTRFNQFALANLRELVSVYFITAIIGPIVFIPVHYLFRGYLTSAGNIINGSLFTLPVNAFALVIVWDKVYKKIWKLNSLRASTP